MDALTPDDADQADRAPLDRLTGRELLALQLRARGYSPHQLATSLCAGDAGGVAPLLQRAAEALGVRTVPAAIAAARRRGLIA